MINADPQHGDTCRNHRLQLAVYGMNKPCLSVEQLLDRVAEPDRTGDPANARRLGTQ